MKEAILVFGSGSQVKVTLDILERYECYEVAGMVDRTINKKDFMGYPILGTEDDLGRINIKSGVIAIGDNWVRSKVAKKIVSLISDFKFVTVIHPSAQIATDVEIGEGTQIMAGACINSATKIGYHCIINTNSSVDHDNNISDFVSINPGVSMGGKVTIGAYSSIGIGSSIVDKLFIGEHTIIGAGAVVVENIPSEVVAYGNPCRVARKREIGGPYSQ